MGRGLSELQKKILILCYRNHLEHKDQLTTMAQTKELMGLMARARALFRRLEERGLVECYRGQYSQWVGFKLTPAGVTVASAIKNAGKKD